MRVILVTVLILLTALWAIFDYAPSAIGCHSRWSGSSYAVRYGPIAGCQVQTKDGWMPERAVRGVN